jgi:UDP-GlcNAc3NAcA epimerase
MCLAASRIYYVGHRWFVHGSDRGRGRSMSKIQVMLVVGARPQFIKSAPLVREILTSRRQIQLSIIHSGQHYDPQMSEIFFRQLQIPTPFMNLRVGSASHAIQTAAIMRSLEKPMLRTSPDLVLVPGDTNTTLAAALTAAKLNFPVAHLEAGLRSGDMSMPEEINRRLTDHCSSMLFAPTRTATHNLRIEGLSKGTSLTGDTMVDTLRIVAPFVERKEKEVLKRFQLSPLEFVLVTMHRPSNVDNLNRLREILLALRRISKKVLVVFPVHPRTRSRITKLEIAKRLGRDGIHLTTPLGYLENLCLLKNANCLLTDSGGMQKESFLLQVPCVTVRSTTEWPETLVGKANRLTPRPEMIAKTILSIAFNEPLKQAIRRLKNPFGDGYASARIADLIEAKLQAGDPRNRHSSTNQRTR